jgi:hypothetical protein
MRYAMLVGCVALGAGLVACGGMRAQTPLLDERPVGASSGFGGGAVLDPGPWAGVAQTPKTEQQQRQLYQEVAKDLRLEPRPAAIARAAQAEPAEATGGGGLAGRERRDCAEVLAANESAAVISGTLSFAEDGLLSVNVPGEGPRRLRTDASTCAVQARRALLPQSLLVGTEVSVSYVMEDGLPTARVVRAAPVRYTH